MSVLIIISSGLSLLGSVPYIYDVARGTTKPRLVSWATWALLTGIAAWASFTEGHIATAILGVCMTLGCLVTAGLAAIKQRSASYDYTDMLCQVGALIGIALWIWLDSPAVAVGIVVLVDLLASVPTLRHAWRAPGEETLIAFILSGVASMLTIIAAESWAITAAAYPLYLIIVNFAVAAVIIKRRGNHAS